MYRWGIIGTGNIAHQFCDDFKFSNGGTMHAVASRSAVKSAVFAADYDIKNVYDNYKELLEDPSIDIVYIATPHTTHYELSQAALRANKHVLCEKPLTLNQQQSQKLYSLAHERKCFLMEAMWTRFNPTIESIVNTIKSGGIGSIRHINADFCFNAKVSDDHRLCDLTLGGGALLDIGIYPLFLCQLLKGSPSQITGQCSKHKSGADWHDTVELHWHDNSSAQLLFSLDTVSPIQASILGEKGCINIPKDWFFSKRYLVFQNEEEQVVNTPFNGKGFQFEVNHVHEMLAQNKLTSDKYPAQMSLAIAETMDILLKQWEIIYPG